ncbi:MAG: class II aldolase/adducin family protein [Bacteroidales bacterium]|nr:class II aldolase/adducin family protein [Bacteroidales bacterium]MCF8387364.1 class II aldolase/adducin family protein [Bacteroidales bacterium]MCF8397842.1 class II aldolase/adducin family protein [Bacteroidales bacterium]
MNNFLSEREEVAYFMRRLYQQKLTTTSGGNVSLRINDENILITPSQLDKGRMQAGQIGIIDLEGNNKTPRLKISMESRMHLSIYKIRKDIKAIVHAHPVIASAFSVMDKEINCRMMGEARYVLGEPQKTRYALMGTQELAGIVAEAAITTNVILLENHGILTVGTKLLEAFDRLEVLEAAAKTTLITEIMGSRKELTSEQIRAIDDLIA